MARKLLLPLLALAALSLPSRAAIADLEAIAPDGFARGVVLTVAGYDASRTTLTDFPVLVRISNETIPGFSYSDINFPAKANADICFTAEDGTPLAFDIDTWDTSANATSLVWVTLPTMMHGTEFAMFYKGQKSGKTVCGDNAFENFVGVWHLGESGDGEVVINDSTENALTGDASERSSAVSGRIGGARQITNKREKANYGITVRKNDDSLAALNTLGTSFVVSFWMRPVGVISTGDAGVRYDELIGRKPATGTKAWQLQLADKSTNMRIWSSQTDDKKVTTIGTVLPLVQNQWTKLDVVYTPTGYVVYADAVQKAAGNHADNAAPVQGSDTLSIGSQPTGGERSFWGDMDEVRLVPFDANAAGGAGTVDWVKADYDQATDAAFLSASAITEITVVAKPLATLELADYGAAYAQFSGEINGLGGDSATACFVRAKAWPTGTEEPAGWNTLATGLALNGTFTRAIVDLLPQTDYTFKIQAANDISEESDVATGTFTTTGAGEIGEGGDIKRVGDDIVHSFKIARDGTATFEFVPPSYATSVEALVVAGGGAGGYRRGGGGGAGGLLHYDSFAVTGGATYDIEVGAGGLASDSYTEFGGNGGASSISANGAVLVTTVGGGAGGNGDPSGAAAMFAGQDGGSGGGAAKETTIGAGVNGQGYAGGVGRTVSNTGTWGGGGGGANTTGGSVGLSSTYSGGVGGDGKPFSITGEEVYYGGGGGGGGLYSQKDSTIAGAAAGGKGGGGHGGQRSDENGSNGSAVAESGKAGTGGGGGGGSNEAGLYKGGDGGSGIVIFRYAVQGNGQGMTTPAVALESLDRNDATGVTTVGYRVAWAGDGCDYADVLAVWGFRKGELDHTNALSSATGVIGRGTGTFTLPDQIRTVYVRLLATNAVAGAFSPEFETVPFVNPAAPEATVSVTETAQTSATFVANVTGLGEGAMSVSGVFQVCADEDFEDGSYLTFPANGTLTEAGTLTGAATGLSFNTAYFVRASLTNDVPEFFETDPVEFRTKVPGAPNGSVVTDPTQVANPPAECAPPAATATTITAWGYLFTPGSGGATYADLRLEASTDANFQTVAAYTATETGVTERGYRSFTLTGLEPETAYYLRLRSENDGHVVKYSDVVGPYTTEAEAAPTAVLTIPALPENVTLVSVTTNGVAVAGVEGAYTVYSNATVVATFAAAEGYRLVGDATVTVTVDADETLTGIPTAELIPQPPATATLTIPVLPEHVTLVSVTTNGVSLTGEGTYTVLSNDTVVVEFAAAEGYRLVGDATVTVVMDEDKTLTGIPMAEFIPIPTVTLRIPSPLPENVSLVSVTTNGVAVAGVEGAYTVYSNATVVATFAAAQGYALSPAATVTVVVDGDKTLTGIPTAVTIASLIKINEIMASNPSVDKGGIASEKGIAEMDWIELYNGSSVDVDLTGWHLSDNAKPGKEDKATILGSCVIPAKGYRIVWLDKIHVDPSEYAADEAFAVLKLSSSGEFLQLADPGKAVVQQVDFSTKKQIKGVSYGPLSVSSGAGLVPGNGPFVYMKTATPGAPNVTEGFGDFTPAVAFSEPHGYKTAAFDLELSCPDAPTAQIYYTLDGSSPTTASTPYTGAIHVDKTTVIRAAVPVENTILQFDTSATYIFLDDVLAQAQSGTAPASAVGFPNDNAVNGQEMLYGMRQDVVTGADRNRLLRGFTNSIATLSVVVDPANLFNSSTGIYVNPRGEGETWERQIMLEGFDPTGVGADFAQPAGIRIRGGYSRRTGKPKHSLRFFFRSSYGESSLAQKMFVGEPLSPNGEGKMKEEIGEYDKLDLRTSQNNSWANNDSPNNDTFVTEVFSRDSQRDLGQPYTRSRYYNLFINGQYWGLYQTQERGDEHWAEAYLGGDSLQYDLIKTASSYSGSSISYSIECNEGTWDAWEQLFHIAVDEGFGGDYTNNYNKILGLNPDGTRNPDYPILLNAESLMVYMLVSHYVVDRDGPTSPFSNLDKGHPNNFYAIRNRDDAGVVKGFVFLRHDAEMSMNQGGNTGPSNNPTFWGTEKCTESYDVMKHRTIPYFTPAELHYLLMQNPVYKRAYADLFYRECLREGGAMTVEKATARYASRMAEIDDAIVCEAARWGQGKTRSTWISACSRSVQFITNRVSSMKTQYQNAGWYPTNAAPYVTDADGVRYFDGGEVPYQQLVYLQNNEDGGTIFYTTNGVDDPMDAGVAYAGGFPIPDEGFTVRARLFKDNEWSPLEEVALEADVPNDQRYGIRVAAIQSIVENDPADEFIILTNKLDRAVDLKDLSIWSEKSGQELLILAKFTETTMLPAHGTIKLTSERWLNGHKLKNDGIYVELRDSNGKRIQNTFVNAKSWHLTDPSDSKSGACNKTGRWLVALEFLGDAEEGDAPGGEVILESQWEPSPEAFPIAWELGLAGATNAVANPSSYTADDLPLALLPAGCEGWTFLGWTNAASANQPVAELPVGTTGAVVNWATWSQAAAAVATVFTVDDGGTTNVVGTYETLAAAIAAAPAGSTVLLLADDSASFTADNLEIGINKAITIDGDGHKLYGLDDYTGGRGDHDIYISGTADITIRNITLADFGGAVPVTGRTYPIWTGSAYSGTLTLDNVTVTNFNRTAFNLNGGTVVVRNCTIAGDMGKGFPGGVFQEGIGVYNAHVTVENTVITGAGSTYEKEDSQIAACIQLGNPNGPAPGTGSITVRSGTFAGQYGIIVASNAMNAVTVQGGAFTGALLAEEGEGGSIAVSGGTFDAPVPAEFAADGYAPTTIADNDGRYTVRTARTVSFTVDGASYTNLVVADGEPVAQPADPVSDAYVFIGWTLNGAAYEFSTPVTEDLELEAAITSLAAAIWIAGASGDWEAAASWDIGYVPTKATIVTFTNDAQVAILGSTDRCKELVLSNANVTLVRDANAAKPVLHFHGNEGRAVSVASGATGSLGVNGIALFTESTDRDNNLTIGCALAVLGDVTFRGINIVPNQLAASFTITGKTTISADATVKTIDWGNTIFLGGIEVAKGVTAKIQTDPNGYAQIGAAVTLVANDGEGDSTTIWLMRSSNRSGKVSLVLGASVSVDADHAATHFIKTSSDEVTDENGLNPITCDVYEAARNPTVTVTTYGVTVTGVESGQRVVPGTNLVIGVSGLAEGYTPSVTIMKHEDYSVLLTTNALSFTYTMPDFDINIVAEATLPSYNDPEGNEIQDQGLISWLADNGFTQDDIDALGSDAAATDKLYECWLLNCSITAENPGGTIHTTGIAVTNGVVSIRVRLDRNAPLGFINGVVRLYGAETLDGGFSGSLVSEEIVDFSEGDSTFDIDPTEASVAQSVTATFSPDDVTARFFKSKIEFPSPGDDEGGDEGGEEGGEEE